VVHRRDPAVITVLADRGVLRPGTTVDLPETESHHLKVRRARGGEQVRLVDGHGLVAMGTLVTPSRVTVDDVRQAARPAPLQLAVAAGDKDRWGWLVEKAAEVGATDLLPVEMERTAGVASRLREEHLDRLRRRALEAIKQSGAAWAPVIHPLMDLEALCLRPFEGRRWMAERGGAPPEPVTAGAGVCAVVGPEGGFTDRERRLLRETGFEPVRLGRHILRFETAALAAALAAGGWHEGGEGE
jgi:16S rRNA (uracil1498-N3)-methyltransferase